ncbi:MAG: hypothetical protein II706_01995 [Bacteroidaceae bacterium]|nr:hypothetical protein [Bacteroidaceae bacterium]
MRRCCYILFLLVLLSACSDNGEVVALLDHAEVVMEEHPDSAYQFLFLRFQFSLFSRM